MSETHSDEFGTVPYGNPSWSNCRRGPCNTPHRKPVQHRNYDDACICSCACHTAAMALSDSSAAPGASQ